MDPLLVGGLFLAACALFGDDDDNNKKGGKRRKHRDSSRKEYLDGIAWQQDHHSDLGL
jgi:hypothetical protein